MQNTVKKKVIMDSSVPGCESFPATAFVEASGVAEPTEGRPVVPDDQPANPADVIRLQGWTRPDGTPYSIDPPSFEPALHDNGDPAPWSQDANKQV